MIDFTVFHQLLGGRAYDLRRNCKARSCEGAAVGDDEGIDSYQLTMRLTSAPPEFPGLIAASVWMKPPGLRASSE